MPQHINPNHRSKPANVPQIVIDTIEEKAQFAYRASKDKRLLTDSNGKICRMLHDHFPDYVSLAAIERIYSQAWIECEQELNEIIRNG